MVKRGRRKQETERIQITLYISNLVDKEIYDYINSGTSNSAAGRELLIDGWKTKKHSELKSYSKMEVKEVINEETNKYQEVQVKEIEIVYDKGFAEEEEEQSFEGYLM